MEQTTTTITTPAAPATKVCKRCGHEKPASEFSARSASADGLQPYCKECQKELQRNRMRALSGPNPDLEPFTPRQLIDELRARGYRGELKYTQTIKL